MSVSAGEVKTLRERTGAGMMDCKKALSETGGDIDAAVALLREKGLAGASKKAGRVTAEGMVGVFTSDDDGSAVVVELNCETDFVAKNEQFASLLERIGSALVAGDCGSQGTGESAGTLPVGDGSTLEATLKDAIASIGENIGLRRFDKITANGSRVGTYVHAGGKIGVLVEVAGAGAEDGELLRSLAMQVAAAFPRYVHREEVDAAELDREREIFRNQALGSGKPDNVVEKIVDGKIEKYFREVCLIEQEYVRDSSLTVAKLLEQAAKDSGHGLEVKRFIRYQLGEGIEKRSENLAEEVAAQIAKGS